MKRKDKIELALTHALKSARTAIRLKYSLKADEEINRVLPEIEKEFHKALSEHRPYQLDVRSLFDEEGQ